MSLFHAPPGLTREEALTGDIQEFTGSGSAHLRVPGLRELHGLRVGRTDIPLELTHHFPRNTNFQEKIGVGLPMIVISEDSDGCPLLLRSITSNDGIWQAGVSVFVRGEWDHTDPRLAAQIAETEQQTAAALSEHKRRLEEELQTKLAAAKTANDKEAQARLEKALAIQRQQHEASVAQEVQKQVSALVRPTEDEIEAEVQRRLAEHLAAQQVPQPETVTEPETAPAPEAKAAKGK